VASAFGKRVGRAQGRRVELAANGALQPFMEVPQGMLTGERRLVYPSGNGTLRELLWHES